MGKAVLLACLLCLSLLNVALASPKVLLFTRQLGEKHEVTTAVASLKALGTARGWEVDSTDSPDSCFSKEGLKDYAAVVFLLTSGNVLEEEEHRDVFESFIRSGGGFAGVHSAADTLRGWPFFETLVGGNVSVLNAPTDKAQTATVLVTDRFHPASGVLPERWQHKDEWLTFDRNPFSTVHVLAYVDEKSYTIDQANGSMKFDHPIAWTHRTFGGRSFYTALGHNSEAWEDGLFLKHVMGGIAWAANEKHDLDKAPMHDERTRSLLENGRDLQEDGGDSTADSAYEKDVLYAFQPGDQPIALSPAPDGRVFMSLRAGSLLVFRPDRGDVIQAAQFPVKQENEDGLLGITLDYKFGPTRPWIYIYWSPVNQTNPTENWLSRYNVLSNSMLDWNSQKILLRIPTQRLVCCHSGGYLRFDPQGNLYLSTGDNSFITTYVSANDLPGQFPFDSQKSSANTNDLRGKIIRITPTDTGGYTIPPGNMFKADLYHKPEIYGMGLRNPFRFAIDSLTSDVWVGDVGPDATVDDPQKGPKGVDEVNKLVLNGKNNFGWPYCIGPNKPYKEWNYTTNSPTGRTYDCSAPTNLSPNSNGDRTLPPAVPATIYYYYGHTEEYPELDSDDPYQTNGRCAMAPLFYRYDANSIQPYKLPAYFDNSLIFMDWFRNIIRLVKMDSTGKPLKITKLWPSLNWKSPIDMAFGPDGRLYVLEFGENFSSKNARLSVLKYLGTPVPIACNVAASPAMGFAPLSVNFQSSGSTSGDGSTLTYSWDFIGNGTFTNSTNQAPTAIYTTEGSYVATLRLSNKKYQKQCTVPILVQSSGNTPPQITLLNPPEGGIFSWGDNVTYRLMVTDAEDGSTVTGGIDCATVSLTPSLGHNEHTHSTVQEEGCTGTFGPLVKEPGWEKFFYILTIQYTDRGSVGGAKAITATKFVELKPSVWQAEHFQYQFGGVVSKLTQDPIGGGLQIVQCNDGGYVRYDNFNLLNIATITLRAASLLGGAVDIRVNSPSGPIIATVQVTQTGGPQKFMDFAVPIQDTNQWIMLDMGVPRTVGSLSLDSGIYPTDSPRGYHVYASLDPINWGLPLDPVEAQPPITSNTSITDIPFTAPVTARYLKVVQTGSAFAGEWWSIAEAYAINPSGQKISRQNWTATASFTALGLNATSAIDDNLSTLWRTGEAQRPGLVNLFFTFRGRYAGETNLFSLNYFTFGGQGVSATYHSPAYQPVVSADRR